MREWWPKPRISDSPNQRCDRNSSGFLRVILVAADPRGVDRLYTAPAAQRLEALSVFRRHSNRTSAPCASRLSRYSAQTLPEPVMDASNSPARFALAALTAAALAFALISVAAA